VAQAAQFWEASKWLADIAASARPLVAASASTSGMGVSGNLSGVAGAVGGNSAADVTVGVAVAAGGAGSAVVGGAELVSTGVALRTGPLVAADARATGMGVTRNRGSLVVAIRRDGARAVAVRVALETGGTLFTLGTGVVLSAAAGTASVAVSIHADSVAVAVGGVGAGLVAIGVALVPCGTGSTIIRGAELGSACIAGRAGPLVAASTGAAGVLVT